MSDYRPISCSFYDELEARATTRQPCTLHFREAPEAPLSARTGVIQDLYIRDKVEYLRLTDGFELRLDKLTAVDDRELRNYC
ncbi:hypothetical protein LJ737_01620 [Hymenobacter sp. 15J16-1T3B]|uniref:hypothetical protein n=1 Tax=Hymenobacter sp. 15J16-1T3B TaxID=2886941 RepID=UPI001D110502|nr:hypothetical protein [Hymenobacter sp. 15J16-1T3B]MCC3155917.1 hypothetical protein [Hymenobacter sp. 15J16-1T3B]